MILLEGIWYTLIKRTYFKKGYLMKLVTVYITTHNRCEHLKRAVNSVLNQSYENIEIIISDDGSSDGTEAYCEDLCDKHRNIFYTKNPTPKGANYARNNAISLASGYFITGLDDDDEFERDRVEIFVKNWNPKFAFLCDNFKEHYTHNEGADKPYYKFYHKSLFSYRDLLFNNLASNQVFTTTDRIKAINGFNVELKKLQDWDCWLRLSYNFGCAKRLNYKTYIMHHDATNRVTNNINFNSAFFKLVESNKSIYSSLNYEFFNKYILNSKDKKLSDVINAKSIFEFKYLLLSFIKRGNK